MITFDERAAIKTAAEAIRTEHVGPLSHDPAIDFAIATVVALRPLIAEALERARQKALAAQEAHSGG